jgi:hypothetical protein
MLARRIFGMRAIVGSFGFLSVEIEANKVRRNGFDAITLIV